MRNTEERFISKEEAIVRADSYADQDKVNAAITSKDLPDILFVDGPTVSVYAANDIIVPLDEMSPEEDWEGLFGFHLEPGDL